MPIDNEKPLGRLIGAWSADLVGYGLFVPTAGPNLKKQRRNNRSTNPLWEKQLSRLIHVYLQHDFRVWTFEVFEQVNGWNDPLPLHPPPGADGELIL